MIAKTLCICGIVFGDRANFRAIEEARMTELRAMLAARRNVTKGSSMAEAKRVERPLSPHLQIYRPQLTSITSILTRITGNALIVGVALVVWWLLAAAVSPELFRGGQCGDRPAGSAIWCCSDRPGRCGITTLPGCGTCTSMRATGWTFRRRKSWAGV